MSSLEVKEIDKQGRVVIPSSWRKKHPTGKVLLRITESSIEISALEPSDLTKFFDSIEVDEKSSLEEWHAVLRELRRSQ